MKKILFTSVGRRVELIQQFKSAAHNLGTDMEIHGGDLDMTAPAMHFCDKKVILPKIRSDEYIPFLLEYCETESIDVLIPTIDTDLLVLSQNRENFLDIGTRVLIAKPEKVAICRDKNYTAEYFTSIGLNAPFTVNSVDEYRGGFPAFIKPKDGSSSINAFKAENMDQLKQLGAQINDYVIQPFVKGTEYTVDVFCDFDGNPVFITPRIRLAVRSGEVLKTEIRQDITIIEEVKKLESDFKPWGTITVQLIKDDVTGINHYIEINPRFGGGAPLSMMAGANAAEAVIHLLNGEKIEYCPEAAEEGAIYSRFDQCVRIN